MATVTGILLRPDKTTPLGGRQVTLGQVGAIITSGGGIVVDRLTQISAPTTGQVTFTVPASAPNSYYVWRYFNGVENIELALIVPSDSGTYTLDQVVSSLLPIPAMPGVSLAQVQALIAAAIGGGGTPTPGTNAFTVVDNGDGTATTTATGTNVAADDGTGVATFDGNGLTVPGDGTLTLTAA